VAILKLYFYWPFSAMNRGCVCNKAVLGLNDRSHLVLFSARVINAAWGGRGWEWRLGWGGVLGDRDKPVVVLVV